MREGQLAPSVDLSALVQQGRAVLDRAADPVRAALERVRAEAAANAGDTAGTDTDTNPRAHTEET